MSTQRPIALVLGANGGIGAEVTRALLKQGMQVRALSRKPPHAQRATHPNLQWHIGDALSRPDVMAAAYGANIIVHAVNPAKYHNWRGLALPMLDNTLAAAKANRARIVFPGTIYNYGRDVLPLVDEDAPQNPHTVKGAIRVEMEDRLRAASWDDDVRVLILRCGDFFGPRAGSSWFTQGMVMGRPVRFVLNPGPKHVHHSWAYLPDVAQTIVRLLSQEAALEKFDTYHFKGHWLTNGDMMQTICKVAGVSTKRVLPFPWWAIRATSSLMELSNEMQEMRYLWNERLELDNTKLCERIGDEPNTPLDDAVRATLQRTGSICTRRCSEVTADSV